MQNTIKSPATSARYLADDEAYQILLARAYRKTGAVPPELVVRHIMAVTAEGDWPVRREALEASLRRIRSLSNETPGQQRIPPASRARVRSPARSECERYADNAE
jgi:hypothetical protein